MPPNDKTMVVPPSYCQYVAGQCDQSIPDAGLREAFFIYPSSPVHLARTIAKAVKQLQEHSSEESWLSWEKLNVGGQIIFCEICKSIRTSKFVVANITLMNFNVLFELGYAIGLGKAVLPVRDSSFEQDKKLFDEIGIFDTLGYEKFTNHNELVSLVGGKHTYTPPVKLRPDINEKQPIYYIRSPIETDGSIKLFSCLKKCHYFRLRTFDVREVPRLSLHECYKQTLSSITVIAHLMDPNRSGANIHNARCAFVCGMALAAGKHVAMLQEGRTTQPIDYRDLVLPYDDPEVIPTYIENIVRSTADTFQSIDSKRISIPKGLLERIDLGDVAAENEIQALRTYFVKTPQFQQARQGHARLVIGRKGSGKTAIFYGIRNQLSRSKGMLVLDLKPEGHQFTRLRETVLVHLSDGIQQHTLTSFWHYLLLLEAANKLIEREGSSAWRDPDSLKKFKELKSLYRKSAEAEGDFSERLMRLVNRIVDRFPKEAVGALKSPEITGMVYMDDIKPFRELVVQHLQDVGGLWILFDNIDKGFPTHGLKKGDVLIVRCLLEATRKLQRAIEKANVVCRSSVFIRRDVYDLLVDHTPDRGKETYANLDWSDLQLVKELLVKRFNYEAPELEGDFEAIWSQLFDPHVGGESSFRYITSRTFLRPRDILNFVRKCIQVAVSHSHSRVEQEDIMSAEEAFSEDMLNELRYELRDIYPDLDDPLLEFLGTDYKLSKDELDLILMEAKVLETRLDRVRDLLLWFCFIGVTKNNEKHYAYQVQYSIPKLLAIIKEKKANEKAFIIHPAFRKTLEIRIAER